MDSDLVERLAWDSEHFGVAVARVRRPDSADRVRAAAASADRLGVRCLTALVEADDTDTVAAAEEAGFRCYDVRVELDHALDRAAPAESSVRAATDADLPSLEAIARERFTASRFFADPNFARDRTRELYVAWLARGMSTSARRTLVTPAGEGFVICQLDTAAAVGRIELIGVAEGMEGRGLGAQLVDGAHAAFRAAGLQGARVVTQGRNLGAQRLYQAHGYRTFAVGLWLHRWAPDE